MELQMKTETFLISKQKQKAESTPENLQCRLPYLGIHLNS